MGEMLGASGKVIDVDLTGKTWRALKVPDEYTAGYIGGKGLGLRLLYDRFGQKCGQVEPLSPENALCVMTGLLAGTGAPCSARFAAVAVSPLTDIFCSCSCGGPFGIALRTAGWDGLIVSGKSESPVMIEVTPEGAAFHDAGNMWGKGISESRAAYTLDRKDGDLIIGPAGENLVRYANIASGHRFFGRGGLGAVMGAKNLKAVIARGGAFKVLPAEPETFEKAKKRAAAYLKRNSFIKLYQNYGTPANVSFGIKAGYLPVRNFRDRTDPAAAAYSGEAMAERYSTKHSTCVPCSILCGHKGTYPDGKVRQIPEYETVGVFGANLGILDPDRIGEWNETANDLGMDTISAGVTLGWAMEAGEKGLRKTSLTFGDAEAIGKAIEDIAYRRGEGDELAEGSRILGKKYGGADFAINVKGMELAAYDPRGGWGHGLNYAVANRGGCHLNAYLIGQEAIFGYLNPYTTRAKAPWVDFFENLFSAMNSLQTCQFTSFGYLLEPPIAKYTPAPLLGFFMQNLPRMTMLLLDYRILSDFVQGISGTRMTMNQFLNAGRRVHVLERYMNTLRGISKKDDTLPGRFLTEGKTAHPRESVVPIESMLPSYYRIKGYDSDGIPLRRTLEKLGIEPVRTP